VRHIENRDFAPTAPAWLPSNNSTPAGRFPMCRLFRPRSTISQSDCRLAFGAFSDLARLGTRTASHCPDRVNFCIKHLRPRAIRSIRSLAARMMVTHSDANFVRVERLFAEQGYATQKWTSAGR
jgi:hypothetical protein